MAIKPMGRLFDVKKWLFQHRHCGEGACSRWVAKRPRFVSEVYRVSRTTTASQPNGSKLPRHKSRRSTKVALFLVTHLQLPIPTATQRRNQLHAGNQSALQHGQYALFIAQREIGR